jgi:hypothetical protein
MRYSVCFKLPNDCTYHSYLLQTSKPSDPYDRVLCLRVAEFTGTLKSIKERLNGIGVEDIRYIVKKD